MDAWTLLLGIGIFLARVTDVSLGTIRTISIIQGRQVMAFVLGLFEVTAWLVVIAAVLDAITDKPVLGVFYAFGFSTGNVVGMMIERRLSLGHVVIRFITASYGPAIVDALRSADFRVTVFSGQGARGPVQELVVVCPRRRMQEVLRIAREIQDDIFFLTEQPGELRRFRTASPLPLGGWRGVLKRR